MPFLFFLLLALPGFSAAQASLPYDAPLHGPLRVTGTFGELRSDHFHAGIDFRAPVGTPVYSVADGYVSRITVRAGGYGQAVYVDHPDGYRSVYCHLERFASALQDTVRARQFAAESFAVDLRFGATAFPLRRGQRLGEVGNRGYSFGAHLHFEMRERAGDVPVNPLAFGFPVPDTRAPVVGQVRVYGYGMIDRPDGTAREVWQQTLMPQRVSPGRYVVRDTLRLGTPLVDFALKTFDRQDAMPNRNGIYGGELFVDSVRWFRFAFDRIPYEDTEYLNALTDYADWRENQSWFHRYHALSPRQFMARPQDVGSGSEIAVRGHPDYRLRSGANNILLRARDYAGNVATVELVVEFSSLGRGVRTLPGDYFLPAGEASIIERGDLRLELDSTALYEDCYFRYARLADGSAGRLSAVHQLHDDRTPLHGSATLAIRPDREVPAALRPHAFVGRCTEAGRWVSYGGEWTAEGRLRARVPVFGDYAIFLDTLPPTVTINYFSTDLRRAAGFSLLVEDNVSSGPLAYHATIDDEWVLMEYDLKNDKLTYDFSNGDFSPGEHHFRLRLTDGRGNTTVFRRRFRR